MAQAEHIIVVGAGSTGAAIAYDLALRGFAVTVVERGEVGSGTTGRNHALLHSGGRYAVKDQESAQECRQENAILRRIAPGVIEPVGGIFAAIDEEDEAYLPAFIRGCAEAGIQTRQLSRDEALRLEPQLNPAVRVAVQVPDGVFDPYRLVATFAASAQAQGARVLTQCRLTGFVMNGRNVVGVQVMDDVLGKAVEIRGDIVINSTGPWAGRVANLAGVSVPVLPSAGVMVALDQRLCRMVVNRLRTPGDGDICVPQRATTLLGTTSWTTDQLDPVAVPQEHIVKMITEGAKLIPAVGHTPIKTAFSSARPLVSGNVEADGREVSRGFQVFDHGRRDGLPGLFTVAGGKTTTSRVMAEQVGNQMCRAVGRNIPCRTAEIPLVPYYRYRIVADRAGVVAQ
ncbi:MAG TPA: FAD-dependent oxidoreductase [Symbiobacteriaceae bacterium]|nr:FAD-dependent oxidoreductase [Symbiobacteriaceae bacterium]